MSSGGFSDLRCPPVIAGNLGSAQRGVVLLVALIFLVILSLLGVSAMTGTVLETKLAANFQERVYALQVAEAGLAQIFPVINDPDQVGGLIGGTPVVVEDDPNDPNDLSLLFDRDEKNGVVLIQSQVDNVTVSYRGRFAAPASNPATASSVSRLDVVYFEVSATGIPNTNDNRVQATLRQGVRQEAPKPN